MSSETQAPIQGIVFAFDFGGSRTGVDIGETLTGSVRPLVTLPCRDGEPNWQQLDQLVKEWQPKQMVVGLPTALDGGKTPITKAARRFSRALEARYPLPVHLHDERLSSQEAESRFKQARQQGKAKRHQAQKLDAMAACVILESWLMEAYAGNESL